ncbi:MAG: nucleotidyltransferase domain-containing protein [Thermoplasmataceae archaeon]
MKYKTIMLDLPLYSRLAKARDILGERLSRSVSFGDLIEDLLGRRLDLVNMDSVLRDYISKFSEKLKGEDHVLGAILFGSVAKDSYHESSDIDILVLADSMSGGIFFRVMEIAASMREDGHGLMERGLPSLISPLIITLEDAMEIRPFFFDVVDYGITLHERGDHVSRFRYGVSAIRHRRELINGAEVLTWQ